MDKLKLYAAPILALVILLAWYFVIRPMLAEDDAPSDQATQDRE